MDNCYGEFTEPEEPAQAGADLVAGSLIKNPGGGLVPAGGYVAGKRELVQNAAFRLTAPGIGKEVGATLGNSRLMFRDVHGICGSRASGEPYSRLLLCGAGI